MSDNMTSATIKGRKFALRMYGHPGKYEGELAIAEFLDNLETDAESGDTDGPGHYGLIRGPIDDFSGEYGEDLTEDEKAYLKAIAGVIILTTSMGFVDVTYFDTKDDLDAAWEGVETAVDTFYEDEQVEEDDDA